MAFFVIIPPGMEPIKGNAMNPAALRRSDIFSDFQHTTLELQARILKYVQDFELA